VTRSLGAAAILTVIAASTAAAPGATDIRRVGAGISNAPPPAVHHVHPSDNLAAIVASAKPADSIVLHGGSYPKQYITTNFASTVFIRGAKGETVNVAGLAISGSNVSISEMNIIGGLRIFHSAHNVSCHGLTVTAAESATAFSLESGAHDVLIARNTILGGSFGIKSFGRPSTSGWPARIRIMNNDITNAHIDEIQIDGARNSVIGHNNIHDPQVNGHHNDGIQVIASDGLRIFDNKIHFNSFDRTGGPNQGIILGHADPPDPARRVTNTVIAGNIIDRWPGTPILLAGGDNTEIFNNTAFDSGWQGHGPAVVITWKRQSYFQNRQVKFWNNIFNRLEIDRGAIPPSYCGYNLISEGSGRSACRSHLLTGNPGFIDHSSYRLRATSRARNTGTSNPRGLLRDIDGRLYGKPDRGARSA
jgi:hypothetical protein